MTPDDLRSAVVDAARETLRRGLVSGARHGVVAVSDTPAEALATCVAVERQAQIAWLVRR